MAEALATKYRQIADDLQARICRGQFEVGDRLPPIRDMAAEAGVSVVTMTRAMQIVARRGFVESRPSAGTVIISTTAPHDDKADRATATIGFVMAHHAGMGTLNPRNQQLLADIQNLLRTHDKRVEFEQINYPFDPTEIDRFADAGWQSMILTGAVQDHHVRALRQTGLSFLVAGTYALTEPCNQVRVDMETSIAGVYRRMFALGLSRIGVVVGRRDFYGNQICADALALESRLADVPFDDSQVIFDETDGNDDKVLDRLIDSMGKPDGLCTTGNLLGPVLDRLKHHRLTPLKNVVLSGHRNTGDRRPAPFSYELLFPGQWSVSVVSALLDLLDRGMAGDMRTCIVPMNIVERAVPAGHFRKS